MSVTIKETPTLVQVGSHWLNLERSSRYKDEPFADEELYPILELDAPRVGFVRARFEANRYVASSYNEAMTASVPVWSGWRIWLKEVETPDPERPDLPHLGRPAAGVGEATRQAIREACLPVIEAWLASDAYETSRRRAVYHAAVREIEVPADYKIARARDTVLSLEGELGGERSDRLCEALDLLSRAGALIEEGKQ